MSFIMNLLGGVAGHYANDHGGSGGGPGGAVWYIAQKLFNKNDDNRYAKRIVRERQEWPYRSRPGGPRGN